MARVLIVLGLLLLLAGLLGILASAERPHHHIFEERHTLQGFHDLKGSGNSQVVDLIGFQSGNILVLEDNLTIRRGHEPGYQIKQGRFSGTVGPDQAYDFTRVYRLSQVVYRGQP